MATEFETTYLNAIGTAFTTLQSQYDTINDAENRRNQLKAFMASVFASTASLAQEEDADGDCILRELMSVHEAIDAAFIDVIERDDKAEPRGQVYSTLNIEDQGMFKPRYGLMQILNGVK